MAIVTVFPPKAACYKKKFEMIISQCDCCRDMRWLLMMFCLCLWWTIMAEIIIIISEFFNYSGFDCLSNSSTSLAEVPHAPLWKCSQCVFTNSRVAEPLFFFPKKLLYFWSVATPKNFFWSVVGLGGIILLAKHMNIIHNQGLYFEWNYVYTWILSDWPQARSAHTHMRHPAHPNRNDVPVLPPSHEYYTVIYMK